MSKIHIPEIVAPGGSYNKAMVASLNWAEAVYVWVPFTSLRMRQNKMRTFDDLKKTINDLHSNGSRAYLTMNIFPRNTDIKVFESVVEKISDVGADAIIFSDPWTYNIIRKYLPNMPLHLSTQASILSSEAVKFWYDLWVKRVVLARELHINEIKQIKKDVPEMELEIFVHWAMCVTYSGRCSMWEYFSGRDWNKWECSHVCRYKFKVYLEEEKRPWKFFQLTQDEDWSHLLSSKDLCTIERLWEIIPYVDGLKIEWRSKSEFYVWSTVKAYKHVRDAIINWTPIDNNIKEMVYEIPHRYYWDGFLFNDIKSAPDGEEPNYKELINENKKEEKNLLSKIFDKLVSKFKPYKYVSTVTSDTAGPVAKCKYFGLVLPEVVEKDWKKYFAFVAKEQIFPWDTLKYMAPRGLWEIKITWVLSDKFEEVAKTDCNKEKSYVSFDWVMNGWEVLYK